MGIEDVSREDAEELGLLKPGEHVAPADVSKGFNQALEESVKSLNEEERKWLELSSGGQVKIEGDTAKLESAAPESTWKDEGLPSAKTWTPEPAPARADADDARVRLDEGIDVADADGRNVRFDSATLRHWAQTTNKTDAAERQTFLPWAIRTVEAPVERWDQNGQSLYLAAFTNPRGVFRAVAVFVTGDGGVITYFLKDRNAVDKLRRGASVQRYTKNPPQGGALDGGTARG
jgi:hypothetical protein